MTKEELKEILKGRFEECTKEEAHYNTEYNYLRNNCIKFKDEQGNIIYFKPVEQFPIIFEGDNFKFKIFSDLTFGCSPIFKNNEHACFTPKDIEANQKALDKLEELRQ